MKNIIMKNIIKIIAGLTAATMLSACATIFSGTSQNINVMVVNAETNEKIEGAVCTVIDGNGTSFATTTNPAAVKVARGNGSIMVNCTKKGYKQLNTSVGDSFNAVSVVNVLFWPGFFVDLASGAYKKYPSHYVVGMSKVKE